MYDLSTILKAVELAGNNLPAVKALYEGFIAVTRGATQDDLKARYAKAMADSDALHRRVQDA